MKENKPTSEVLISKEEPELRDTEEAPDALAKEIMSPEEYFFMTNYGENIAPTEVTTEKSAERPKSIGEQRYEKVSESITNAKKSVGGWFKSGFSKIGRMWKSGASAVLETPEAYGRLNDTVNAGYEKVEDKIVAGADALGAGINQGVEYVEKKVEQFGDSVEAGATQLKEYGAEKMDQLSNWADEKTIQATVFTVDKIAAANEFISHKAEQTRKLAEDGAALTAFITALAVNATAEKINQAKEGVKNRWNSLVEFGRNSITSNELKAKKALANFNLSFAQYRSVRNLEKARKSREKTEKREEKQKLYDQKVAQWQTVANQAYEAAA